MAVRLKIIEDHYGAREGGEGEREGLAVISVDGQIEHINELLWEAGELWVGVGGGGRGATSTSAGATLPTGGTGGSCGLRLEQSLSLSVLIWFEIPIFFLLCFCLVFTVSPDKKCYWKQHVSEWTDQRSDRTGNIQTFMNKRKKTPTDSYFLGLKRFQRT